MAPRLNETMPLTLFYHSDENLIKAIKSLRSQSDSSSDTFRRRNERVHKAQRMLLDSIYIIYQETDDTYRASREYRRQLPLEDQRELESGFSENILFAAQALSRGFRIRGIEQFTPTLVQPALELAAALEALRFVFRSRALRDPTPFHQDLFEVIGGFDAAWTRFEQRICFCYFEVTNGGVAPSVKDSDMLQVLMSETLIRAIHAGHISTTSLSNLDPSVLIALPRLTIIAALVHTPTTINITSPSTPFRWFRSEEVSARLDRLSLALSTCEPREVAVLERLLAAGDEGVEAMDDDDDFADAEDLDVPVMPTTSTTTTTTTTTSAAAVIAAASEIEKHSADSIKEEPDDGIMGVVVVENRWNEKRKWHRHADSAVPNADASTTVSTTWEGDYSDLVRFEATAKSQSSSPSKPLQYPQLDSFKCVTSKSPKIMALFRDVCQVSDTLSRARDFLNILQLVFQMHTT